MSETTQLLTEADALAAVADSVSGSYAVELARVLRDLERQLRSLAIAATEGSQTALARAVRAAKLRKEIQQALEASGFHRLTETATSASLDRLVTQVEKLREAANFGAFTTADQSRIVALQNLGKLDLFGVGDEIAQALWRTLAQGIYSMRPLPDLLQDLSDAIDTEETKARTLYDTLASIFTRQVEVMKSSGADDEPFAYVGPLDSKTRPFCIERVGRVYTRTEIDAMDNGQLPNVFLTGGGYNCRHVWQAVSKFSDLRDLVGTGQRAPEVQTILDSMAA